MPLDAICINGLTKELSIKLTGAKIDKVQQPARDILILSLHGEKGNFRLLLSSGTGTARAHITAGSFENPQSPPMFCMLLRKHLVGARISEISQPDFERMMVFELDAFDELGDQVKKRLIIEMMGRNSNIILTGGQGHIIDCLRRVDSDMSRNRQVLPGLIYRMPPKQEKKSFFALSEDEIALLWHEALENQLSDKWLLECFSGLSPVICREISYQACGAVSKALSLMDDREKNAFLKALLSLSRRVQEGGYEPTLLLSKDSPMEFSFMPLHQYENAASLEPYPDFSSLLDAFYTRRDKKEVLRRKASVLSKSVKSAHERTVRKLALRREELSRAENRELYRKRGDLVTANLYRIKKGDRILKCEDYFEEGSPEIEIELDPLKTPQQNAARFYREYNKAKTAQGYLSGLIEKGEKEEAYLASVIEEIERAENERDLEEIRRELMETGFIKAQRNAKKEKAIAFSPMRFLSSSGMEIRVGKNNVQNDQLTLKAARRSDLWLHAQKIHGSHVVVSCHDAEPDEETILEAAGLAAYFSQAKDGGKVPVDYTMIRYVKKPSGTMPGAVVYTDYKTIMAQPDEKLVERLRAKSGKND